MISFSNPSADLFIPDNSEPSQALGRTTHLGIGAHQDDLEVMALHGILACYQSDERWFGGVTVTNRTAAKADAFAGLGGVRSIALERDAEAKPDGQQHAVARRRQLRRRLYRTCNVRVLLSSTCEGGRERRERGAHPETTRPNRASTAASR